jgi:hypothetical protein
VAESNGDGGVSASEPVAETNGDAAVAEGDATPEAEAAVEGDEVPSAG